MKCTKKIMSIILILCMVATLLPMTVLATYTYADNGFKPVEVYGENSLFISDIHAEGDTNDRLEQLLKLADPNKEIAIIAVGGDYEAGMDYTLGDVTDSRSGAACIVATNKLIDAYYGSSEKWGCDDPDCNNCHVSIVYTKGNHESGKKDWSAFSKGAENYLNAEAAALNDKINADFLAFTEWPDSGHVATVYGDEAKTSIAYYLYAMGWQCNGGDKSMQFSYDESVGLMKDFEKWYAESGNDGSIPVFIVSHSPIHYYNDRRTPYHAANAIETFNKYPNLVFCWGHNHTERDPLYTQLLEAGDLMTVQLDDGTVVEKEILFSYTGLGSIRANGHMNETGFLAQFKGIGDPELVNKSVDLTFYFLENKEVMKVLEADEAGKVDDDTTINFYDPAVISRAAVEVAAPVTGAAPAAEVEFSDRFSAAVKWTPAVEGNFKAGVAYTAEVVLTAEEGFAFAEAPEIYLNDAKVADVKVEGNTATLTCEFEKTLYYTDVPVDSKYYDCIGALTDLGVINGYGDGTFGIADAITEAHFDLMVSRSGAVGVELIPGMTRADAAKAIYDALDLSPVIVPREGYCVVTFSDGQAFEAKIGEDFVFFFQCDAPGDMGAPAEGEEGAGITVSEGTVAYSNVGLGGPNKYPTSEKVTISGFTGDITVTITEAATNMGATYTIYTEEADIAEAIAFAEKMAAQMAANPMPEGGGEMPPEMPQA